MNFNRTPEQIAALDKEHGAILDHQSILLKAAIWRSCLNCDYFLNVNGCMIYKTMPPPKVIVNGCRDWENEIPF